MKRFFYLLLSLMILSSCAGSGKHESGYHLFILAGQSNMVNLDINDFLPIVNDEFGANHVLAVKDAYSGMSIVNWYDLGEIGPYYTTLMDKVFAAIEGKEIIDVTFIWMQGESDFTDDSVVKYKENLIGLMETIESDLGMDMNFVIGRLNQAHSYLWEWNAIRDIQVDVAENYGHGTWVNTDDLGDDIHYDNYELLAQRFALASISLIEDTKYTKWIYQ